MLGSPAAGPGAAGGGPHRTWQACAPACAVAPHVPSPSSTAPTVANCAEALRYGLYSVFPGGAAGSATSEFYSHATAGALGRFTPSHAAAAFHAQHKFTKSTTGCYTFGAPTPPPGSPYSPLPVAQLELLAKSFNNNNNLIIQQAPASSTPTSLSDFSHHTTNNNPFIHNNNNISISNFNATLLNLPTPPAKKEDNLILNNTSIKFKNIDDQYQKRWEKNPMVPLSVKTESNSNTKRLCGCRNTPSVGNSPVKTKFISEGSGCSRTNPVSWTPSTSLASATIALASSSSAPLVQVKREPSATPAACQVAEVTTSNNTLSETTIVKVEATSPNTKSESSIVQTSTMSSIMTCTTGNGTIPVGIAVARQRLQQELTPTHMSTGGGLLTTTNASGQMKEITDTASVAQAAMTVGVSNGAGSLLHCGEDRTNGITSWPLPPTHSSTLATPTLWQYPAPLSMEQMLPLPVPMPPVGFQLVRDPSTGHFLLIPTTSFEQLPQAVVWPSYSQPSSHVLIPPIPPPPLAPLQLVGSATSDYLTTASTTLHQHTQTHSTRLVALTTDTTKRKLPLPAHTLIKIESDCATTPDQGTKTLQTVSTMATNSGTAVFTDPNLTPLLTTHVFYQPPTNLIQISQPAPAPTESLCRSQATSPVTCLTPPPETVIQTEVEDNILPGVQDASNQTDTPICSEDDSTINNTSEIINEPQDEPTSIQTEDEIHSTQVEQDISSATPVQLKIPVVAPQSPPKSEIKITVSVPSQLSDIKIPAFHLPSQIADIKPTIQFSTTHIAEIHEKVVVTEPMLIPKIVEIHDEQPIMKNIVSSSTSSTNEEKLNEVINITKPNNVDLSGLELLSNSIVEFENCRKIVDTTLIKVEKEDSKNMEKDYCKTGEEVLRGISDMSLKDEEYEDMKNENDQICQQNDTLGGLGLLCALAEQRIMEEVSEKTKKIEMKQKEYKYKSSLTNVGLEKKVLKRSFEDNYMNVNKKCKLEDIKFENKSNDSSYKKEWDLNHDKCSTLKLMTDECGLNSNINKKSELSKGMKTDCDMKQSDRDIKCTCIKNIDMTDLEPKDQDISRKSHSNDWSKMNSVEKHMRMKLAELRRQYKEKQFELSKLTPRTDCGENCLRKIFKKSRRKSSISERSSPSPPKLEKIDSPIRPRTLTPDILKPATLCTSSIDLISKSQNTFSKFTDTKKELNIKKDIDESQNDTEPEKTDLVKQSCSPILDVLSDSAPSGEKISSSKKRKVGRPKKLSTPNLCEATEMIVAKKPKSLVGYLLAAKNRLHSQQKHNFSRSSPPRYIEDSPSPKPKQKSHRKSQKTNTKTPSVKKKSSSEKKHSKKKSTSKIRPKLKAEPKVKTYSEDEDHDKDDVDNISIEEWNTDPLCKVEETNQNDDITVDEDQNKVQQEQNFDSTENNKKVSINDQKQIKKDMRCVLTAQHLEIDKLRVLTSMGGLFYAGVLSAIQAPDVYAITLDGERGNRPHIMSREEILRDAIVEVSPQTTEELLPGARLCAYWSQQYRCLYPGTVAEPGTPDPDDDRFVSVEFDDGDSGRIALEDIRLLQPDYPIIEYDPNPLLSLSKRKRRTSINSIGEEIRRSNIQLNSTIFTLSTTTRDMKSSKSKELKHERKKLSLLDDNKSHKIHKKLKKHRRNKLKHLMKNGEEKKHKRKHKCCDEHCKHRRHHKKHRKHKKHHHGSNKIKEQLLEESSETVVEILDEEKDKEVDKNITENVQDENKDQEDVESAVDDEDNININTNTVKESKNAKKSKKVRERQESVESRSKMAAFLPARQLWGWSGKGYKRPGAKGRAKKQFFKAIQRGKETIRVGDAAVFLSTGRPDRPYIGCIEAMWESWGNNMVVKVKWFYHPEETTGCPQTLKYLGALFESPHVDENDVQTISHKCEVLPLKDFTKKLGSDPQRYAAIYDNNDIYYRAGYYDPTTTTLTMEPEIPILE